MIQNTRAWATAALVAALLVLLAGTVGPSAAQAAGCAKANASPSEASSTELAAAVACLVNKERKQAGKKPVKPNRDLARVAAKHTGVMLETDCLDHRCPGESRLEERILRSGYLDRGGRYGFGENTGCAITPAAMVDVWMAKRRPSRIILGKRFRDVGIAASKGSPDVAGCDEGGPRATYTLILAWRNQ